MKFFNGQLFVNREDVDTVYEVLNIDSKSIKFTDQFTGFRIDFSVEEQVNWLNNCVDYYDIDFLDEDN